ncbi:hypothetical protein V2A60_004613 [Cordyceps javanica]
MVLEGDVELGDQRVETEHDRETSGMRDLMEPVDMKALEERTTRARGRPRIPDAGQAGRKSLASRSQAANGRQFKCEKCAGTWKNDVGLKYHLEKSQTHCNPSFKPHLISSSKASGFALIKRHALQTTRPTRKNNNTHADDLFADGKSSCVQPIGEKQTNFKGKGVLGLAVSSIRKKHHQKVELAKINEDISILSGQAKLLTAVSVSSPRQVDPFAKPAVRQFAARRHSKSMPEDPEASKSCGRPQQVVFEASEAHPVVSALTPPDSALPAEHVKEPPEKLRIKNPVRHVLMNIITELLYRHSGTLPTDIETEVEYNVQLPTRAHNVFINFHGGDTGIHLQMPMLQWHKPNRRQSITADAAIKADDNAVGSSSVSAVDNEPEPETATLQRSYFLNSDPPRQRTPTSLKRLTLASRILTPLAPEAHEHRLAVERRSDVDDNEIVAAFVVIRSLLGGIDRTIDWGLLAHLFPTIGLQYLRRFWARLRKEQASFMAKATQEFQDSLILAIQADEIAIPNYERPLDYDWMRLIQWAIKHPNQEHLQLPSSRERFNHEFTCKSGIDNSEDWKEKFFHPQSSVYARFEAATLHSGSLTTTEITQILRSEPALSTVDVARSWIRSLCCTSETEYTPQDVKERFSMLSQDTQQRNTAVLKTAIDQLTLNESG